MNRSFEFIQTHRKVIYGLILAACLVNGLALALINFREALGMGDNSTFYAFARNISQGEVIYKDFIHFRTPGTIAMFSLFLTILGGQQSSVELGTRIETQVLYPLIFIIAGILLYKKSKNPLYVFSAFLGIAFIPGVAQLRSAFGLLAIAVYAISFESKNHQKRYMFGTGLLAGITFIFGQEIALMVAVCVGASELIGFKNRTVLMQRIKYLLIGALVGLMPLLLYVVIFSDIRNFLYYTLYYSFVQQPKFMNLPFPNFGYTNLMYFMPFFIYLLCFLVLYCNKKFGKKEAILLSFGILRLITALGRSDFGHFLFSIQEIFLIVPYFLAHTMAAYFNKETLRKFLPYGMGLIIIFLLGIYANSIFIVLAPPLILYALHKRPSGTMRKLSIRGITNTSLALGVSFAILVYMLLPTYISVLKGAKHNLFADNSNALYVGGIKTDPVNYQQIKEVEVAANELRPKTIFAFPIQPFYYVFANHHGSRFLTFEPQTTLAEQKLTIGDLKRTKPEMIVFDPLQAHGLSGSLSEISDFIMSNYDLYKEVAHREILWVMVPKKEPAYKDKLVYQLYRDNKNKADANGIQNREMNLDNAIAQKSPKIRFIISPKKDDDVLHVSIAKLEGLSHCGNITIKYSKANTTRTQICVADGRLQIPVKAHDKDVELVFEKTTTAPLVWNDPEVVE